MSHRLAPPGVLPSAITALLLGSTALAQGTTLDLFQPVDPLVIQAVQSGSTPLVAGKSTAVRAPIGSSGTAQPGTLVDGILRIFVGGVELPNSPIYSDNGPIPIPSVLDPNVENASLNFLFVAPQASNVVFTVELNPAGPNQVPETNTQNNSRSTPPLTFVCRKIPEIVYVPVDYRPSGGSVPNLPDLELIAPGMGDNFLQGTYPVPDVEYRRSDFPSKLWTSSLSGTGSGLNSALLADLQLMNPQPNFIYGWVPGGLPYNGQALGIPGQAAMGNTQDFRFQRTFAHEVGHLHGLQHIGGTTGLAGFDVERHLALPLGLPTVKPSTLSDHMVAGLNTNQAWTGVGSYTTIFNNGIYNCAQDSSDSGSITLPTERRILISGVFDRDAGTIEVDHSLVFAGGKLTTFVPRPMANLLVRLVGEGGVLSEHGLYLSSSADHCAECRGQGQSGSEDSDSTDGDSRDGDSEDGDSEDSDWHDPTAGFALVLPTQLAEVAVTRVEFWLPGGAAPISSVSKASAAPQVEWVAAGPLSGDATVAWTATGGSGEPLRAYLRYSPDGRRLIPLVSGILQTSARVDFTQLPEAVGGEAFLELMVSQGLSTTTLRREWNQEFATFNSSGNAPWVRMLSPDNGTTWKRRSTVILHSSGWDLEDRALTGNSIQWSSSLDGFLGAGRVTAAQNLSVGNHVITVTGTDSRGMATSATANITVVDRPLPGLGLCQPNLGSGGPGNAVLSVCGEALSSGASATLSVSGAPASVPLWLLLSAFQNPTPIFGGVLLASPPLVPPIGGTTNPAGAYQLSSLPGGGGPFSLYVQAVVWDPAQAFGFGLSNAVRVDFLP